MVEVMNIIATSFKMSLAYTAEMSGPEQKSVLTGSKLR